MKFLVIVGLALGAAAGCDASGDNPGFGSGTGGEPVNQRGDVDAGGVGGAGGGGAGSTGAGGAPAPGTGGASAAGGRTGAGGMSGSGGAAGGSATDYAPCIAYSWSPSNGGGCTMQSSPGVFLTGYKDGRKCGVCSSPARAAGVPECTWESTSAICVLSCDECTFQ